MFHLFGKSKPLLEDSSVQWLFAAYGWALRHFDAALFFRETRLVLPDNRHFPGRADTLEGMAELIFARVKDYAGVAHWPTRLVLPNSCSLVETPQVQIKGALRGPGGILGVLGKLGAVRTSVPFSEVRQAMDSGVIDAASFAPHAHLATNSYKVGQWATTNLNLGSANCPVVVNTDALKALKPEHREALLGSVDEALAFYVENYEQNTTKKYEQAVRDQGLTLVTFTPEQTARLNELAESVRQEWIASNSDSFDARALFDFTAQLFAE